MLGLVFWICLYLSFTVSHDQLNALDYNTYTMICPNLLFDHTSHFFSSSFLTLNVSFSPFLPQSHLSSRTQPTKKNQPTSPGELHLYPKYVEVYIPISNKISIPKPLPDLGKQRTSTAWLQIYCNYGRWDRRFIELRSEVVREV